MAGVSLDEEMVNLIKFQNSYSAASRMMITAVDEMLRILIANTGIVSDSARVRKTRVFARKPVK